MKNSNKQNLSYLGLDAILLGMSFMGFLPVFGSSYYKIFVFCITFLILLKKYKIIRKNKGFVFFIIFLIFEVLNIMVNNLNNGEKSLNIVSIMCLTTMLFAYECYLYNDYKALRVFVFVCNIWNMISFVDVLYKVFIIHYDSYNTSLILCGYDNGLGAYMLPLALLNLYFYMFKRKQKRYIFFAASCLIQLFLIHSATAIVGAVLLATIFLFEYGKKREVNCIKPIYVLALDVATFVFVVIFRVYDNKYTRFIIEQLLHKEMNFSGRLQTWNSGILYFLQKPIWGHGRDGLYQMSFFHNVTSSHNIFLDILDQVGIIGFILFDIMLIMTAMKKSIKLSRECWIINIGAFILIFVLQFESYCSYYGYSLVFMNISLAYYLPLMYQRSENK